MDIDTCNSGFRNISFGGKDSTEYVVKGSHNDISQVFIDELGRICKVCFNVSDLFRQVESFSPSA